MKMVHQESGRDVLVTDRSKICKHCLGHRWMIWLLDRKDGSKPTPQVRSCPACNLGGVLPIGATIDRSDTINGYAIDNHPAKFLAEIVNGKEEGGVSQLCKPKEEVNHSNKNQT